MVQGRPLRPQRPHPRLVRLSKTKPANAHEGVVFRACRRDLDLRKEAKAWYFHRFYDFQPDLNTANPHVQAEILKIMGFWIQLGVSGFRMDAVPFVIAEKGPEVSGEPHEQFELLRLFREFLQWRQGDAIILAEDQHPAAPGLDYFGEDADRMHMCSTSRSTRRCSTRSPRPMRARW